MADTVAVERVSTLIERLTDETDRLVEEVYGRGNNVGLRSRLDAAEKQNEHLADALDKAKARISTLERWQTDVKIKVAALSLTLGGGSAGTVAILAQVFGG